MKKIIVALIIIISISCTKEKHKNYMIFSGKIDNCTPKKIKIKGYKFSKTITINKGGTFSDTLKVSANYYSLYDGKRNIPMYLTKTDNLNLYYNFKDSTNTFTFSGKNSSFNIYLQKKEENKSFKRETYSLKEEIFLNKLNQRKEDTKKLLVEANLNTKFEQLELKHITYNYQLIKSIYYKIHTKTTKKKTQKLSKNILNVLKSIDFNNEEDYIRFNDYRKMLAFKLQKLVSEKLKEGKNSYDITYLDAVYNNVSNQNIKNTLLAKNMQFNVVQSEDVWLFHKKFTEYSSDKKNNKEVERLYNIYKPISKGKPSPKFFNYENYNGGTNSLDDFKGKYVYINLWATWCSFCKAQIPYLKEVEKKYLSKNIKFVSISMDTPTNYKTWRKMVKDKKLTGVQLIANKESKFGSKYFVNGLPKFILIDPLGNIVTANAPRPSNKRLIKILNELEI